MLEANEFLDPAAQLQQQLQLQALLQHAQQLQQQQGLQLQQQIACQGQALSPLEQLQNQQQQIAWQGQALSPLEQLQNQLMLQQLQQQQTQMASLLPTPVPGQVPCSACMRIGVQFSAQQQKLPPEKRKCLQCMAMANPRYVQHRNKIASGDTSKGIPDAPKLLAMAEPCSICMRIGVLYSRRQTKLPPETRRCMECMIQKGDNSLKDSMVPSAIACAGCGRSGALFSKQEIELDVSVRRCLQCKALASLMAEGIEPGQASILGSSAKAPEENLPKENTAPDEAPCSLCRRTDVTYSNRMVRLPPNKRRCLQCMNAAHEEWLQQVGAKRKAE